MPFDIKSGTYTTADPLQPLDASGLPGVAPPTAIVAGQLSGPTIGARDTTAEFQQQRVAGEDDCRAAQAAAMNAEDDRRAGYQAQILPAGSHYGDAMNLPPVPSAALPPTDADWYAKAGDEPEDWGT